MVGRLHIPALVPALLGAVLGAAGSLAAHPLDDNADMQALVRVLESEIELQVEFRYRSTVASYTEFANGLDRNLDGTVTAGEVTQRFIELADEIAFGVGLSLDGELLVLQPDFSRFEFRDLEDPGADIAGGIQTPSARVFYRFVYRAPAVRDAGRHSVEFFFSGPQTVVHTPHQQLKAVDAAGNTLPSQYDLALQAFPRMTAIFDDTPAAQPQPARAETPQVGLYSRGPPWLALAGGGLLALLGLVLATVNLVRRRGGWLTPAVLLLAGAAVLFGALGPSL